jgi:MT0933-like antitoxin protein
MSRIAEWLKKAEIFAKGHSEQTDRFIDRAERFAKERTGHKYDRYIEKGAETVQRRYRGERQRPGEGQQPRSGETPPDQESRGR